MREATAQSNDRPKVLVIDDSVSTCLLVSTTLRNVGCEVEIALNGQDGLLKAMRSHPHCLILDVLLPDISGYALCRQMRQSILKHVLHIILISTKNAPLDQRYGLSQGADHYLPKPFTAQELIQVVQEGIPTPYRHAVPPRSDEPTTNTHPTPGLLISLGKLIPHRTSNPDLMRTSSPFRRSVIIADNMAHRLYMAIDGKKTIAELARVTALEVEEMVRALYLLLEDRCIQIADPAGRSVEMALRFLLSEAKREGSKNLWAAAYRSFEEGKAR